MPSFLLDPLGPLSIRLSYLPQGDALAATVLLAARTPTQIEATARAMRTLLVDAPKLHAALAAEAGVSHLIERRGVLHVYPDRATFEADARAWEIRSKVGISWLELPARSCASANPTCTRYTFGVMVEEAGHVVIRAFMYAPFPNSRASAGPSMWQGVRSGSGSMGRGLRQSSRKRARSPGTAPSLQPARAPKRSPGALGDPVRSRASAAITS